MPAGAQSIATYYFRVIFELAKPGTVSDVLMLRAVIAGLLAVIRAVPHGFKTRATMCLNERPHLPNARFYV